ncbi:histidinol dehydrogenase [Microbacterium sp. YY-01]|uniref:histidinol dehydrogenase n=1 Tax=Microbacterium sp. YY-01 TaxID=3421634 RepID=UPI003D1769AF
MQDSWWLRAVAWLIVAAIGAFFGVASTVAHGILWGFFPVGMVLGTIALAGLMLAVRMLVADRWACVAAGLGIFVAVVLLSGKGPGGSILVADTLWGRAWGVVVAAVVVTIAAWPDLSRLNTKDDTSNRA